MTDHINYQRIAKAITYLKANFKLQPSLDEVAQHVGLSPFHFQKLFTDWAGVSPKKFVQYLSINYAKSLLKEAETNLFDTAFATGLSGTSRLHDLFVNIEGMTPGEYKNGGQNLSINYSFHTTFLGEILIASTKKGVCYLAFIDEHNAFELLKAQFQNAVFTECKDDLQEKALSFFKGQKLENKSISLHLKGTDFQLKVWEALLKIPFGGLSTYGNVSNEINSPNAARAVGTAIGKNPVALIIPCHRVIQGNGSLGGYMWGLECKVVILGWEAGKIDGDCFNGNFPL
ncbi:bifunctional helix-turn-helix domain-containing protein/methylated-DNA--[protein]-cysteine S-methyltransferase [Pedobacter alpinus]|uniref:Bifunctional helix-turn-helix domain-containing protein/methylated-DNA--[protein]-cysteine S-methyltransferase n=1 Tax=Pedobacter alpinus TaxID=1590643 RepID=A0ABW5TVJ8_9SPHI